ncbi:MAG TPA: hypothetical protein VLH84_03160 [Patescibacteria group bacterium]|nr:hypothetical protein [Patescibacteria group bacterium]
MESWTFYPVFIATLVSVMGLSYIAVSEHTGDRPRPLSELAVAEQPLLARFRNILLFCGALFAVTVFGFIVPRVNHPIVVAIFGGLMIGGELLAALIPARHKTAVAHAVLAQTMALGMLGLAVMFWLGLATFVAAEAVLALVMCAAAILMLTDRKRFIMYELAFIFSSHFTILIAAMALR